jgi:hypothetical protein
LRKNLFIVLFGTSGLLASVAPAPAADVSINVNFPAPVVVLPAPPQMVWVSAPGVYIALGAPQQIFFQDDQYYLYEHNTWYAAPGYGGPWVHVTVNVLPRGLRGYRGEHWDDYQHEARHRYHDNDDRHHQHFVGWKHQKPPKSHYHDDEHGQEHGKDHGHGRHHEDD